MSDQLIQLTLRDSLATIALNDPAKRNALGIAMFDALQAAIHQLYSNESIHFLLLRGEGPAFCAGFDLTAAASDPSLMPQYIKRLSSIVRMIRCVPQIVVAAVHGGAIAGGCALLGACDFVIVAPDAKLGYPVHRIGISPAVTIPTLQQMIGPGAARSLLMSGELLSGIQAHHLGLATHLAPSSKDLFVEAAKLCQSLAAKGQYALRTTKAWLNELDGSLSDQRFDMSASASAAIADTAEARALLTAWQFRSTF